jgi:hypothetical protein
MIDRTPGAQIANYIESQAARFDRGRRRRNPPRTSLKKPLRVGVGESN